MRAPRLMGTLSGLTLCLLGWGQTAHAQRGQYNPNQPNQDGQQQIQNGQFGQQNQPGQVYEQNGDASRGRGAPTERAQVGKTDREIAECVALANQTELQIAQYARDRVKDEDVRKFVDTIIRDHQEFAKELQKHGGSTQMTGSADQGNRQQVQSTQYGTDQNQQSQNQGTRRQIRRGQTPVASPNEGVQYTAQRPVQEIQNPSMESALNWRQIEQELSKQCVGSAKKELDDHDGHELDECFVGMQIAAHQHMLDKLTVLRRHASRELRSVLYEGINTSEEHLEKAKELMKELAHSEHHSDKSDSSRSAEN